jgi:AcrR family transcriptional regulator
MFDPSDQSVVRQTVLKRAVGVVHGNQSPRIQKAQPPIRTILKVCQRDNIRPSLALSTIRNEAVYSLSGQETLVSHPSARERILQEGLNLASTRGLCRVTFGAVARRANVSKSGIVAHFSSMDNLKRAIVDRAMELWSGACFGSATETLAGLARLTRYLKDWISWTRRAGLPGACPIALAMFEYTYNGGSSSVRVAVAEAEGHWRRTLVDLVQGAIARSEIPQGIDSSQLAWNLVGVYLSHHVSCHFLRASDADLKALSSLEQLIGCAKRLS